MLNHVPKEISMFSKIRIALGLALILSLAIALPVFAGGWAVISLDELPTNVIAGEPIDIGFVVLQHGKTPLDDLYPTITVMLPKEEHFVVDAEADGKPGHYTATLTFPKEGNWEWTIQAFTLEQPMPTLSVAAAAVVSSQPAAKSDVSSASMPMLSIISFTILGVGLAGLVFAYRRRSRFTGVIAGVCLLVGIMLFVTAPTVPAVEAQSKSSAEVVKVSSISQVELGRQLFVAKGCITCHVNNKVAHASNYWTVYMGAPNLTDFSASPEALRLRLKDPTSVKSDTQMPNLNLSDTEIDALIAFINSK
jgi:hypothetical protein